MTVSTELNSIIFQLRNDLEASNATIRMERAEHSKFQMTMDTTISDLNRAFSESIEKSQYLDELVKSQADDMRKAAVAETSRLSVELEEAYGALKNLRSDFDSLQIEISKQESIIRKQFQSDFERQMQEMQSIISAQRSEVDKLREKIRW